MADALNATTEAAPADAPATPPTGEAPPAEGTAPEATPAPQADLPAEPDIDALAGEQVKEHTVPLAVVRGLREKLREARGKLQQQGKEAARTAAPTQRPARQAVESEYGDEEAEEVPQFRTQAELDSYLQERMGNFERDFEDRLQARLEQRQLERDFQEAREDAIDDLRERTSALRQQVLPKLSNEAADGGDLLAWAFVQREVAQQARGKNLDPADYLLEMDDAAMAGVLANSVRQLKAFVAAAAAPQTKANEEAERTAPLTSDGVAAERQPDEPKSIHDPKFLERVRAAITGAVTR